MNTIATFVVVISLLSCIYSQPSLLSFDVSIVQGGTIDGDRFEDVKTLSDGSFLVCGSTSGSLYGLNNCSSYCNDDYILVKYRPDLTVSQGFQFGTQSYDECNAIAVVEATNTVYMVSSSGSTPAIHAINSSTFATLWMRQGTYDEYYNRVAYDSATNRVVILGVANYTASLSVLDTNGILVWNTLLPGSDWTYNANDIAYSLAIDSLGNIYAAGTRLNSSGPNPTQEDGWYAKVYPSGSLAWYKTLATEEYEELTSITVNSNTGDILIAGYSQGRFDSAGNSLNESGMPHGVLISVRTSDGGLNWVMNQSAYSNETIFGFFHVKYYAPEDLIYILGATSWGDFPPYNISGSGSLDWFVEVFSSDGQQIRYLNVSGSSDYDFPSGFDVDGQGNFIAVGGTSGNWSSTILGDSDYLVMQGTLLTDLSTTTTSEDSQSSPGDFLSGSGTYIIGGAIGGVVLLSAAIVVGVLLVKKYKNKRRTDEEDNRHSAVAMTPTPKANTDYVQMGTSTPPQTTYTTIASEFGTAPSSSSHTSMRPTSTASKDEWIIQYNAITIEKKIGVGAFGEVFKGTWRGVEVAVKKMIGEESVHLDIKIQDFFTEAEVMKKIKPHYNITQLYGVCVQPLCIVTEYVANGSLYEWLISKKELNDEAKFNIIKGTAAGMLHLHSQGVIHRDLAARNILLDKTLSPKVSDFGMSRVALDNKTNRTANDIGPIKWMAPEAMTDRIYNSKTDVWSFGVVIYEVLTRQSPYEGYNLMEVATGIMSGKISLLPMLKEPQRKYSKVLVELAEMCLQREPKHRPEFDQVLTKLS